MLQRAIIERVKNRRNRENNRKDRVFQDAGKRMIKMQPYKNLSIIVQEKGGDDQQDSAAIYRSGVCSNVFSFVQSRIEKSPAVLKGATERIFDAQNANAAISSILPSASA